MNRLGAPSARLTISPGLWAVDGTHANHHSAVIHQGGEGMSMRLSEGAEIDREPLIAVVGRQGSGKGTQGERLAQRFGMTHLSTGDLLRAAVAQGSPVGRKIERALVAGELVSDDLMVPVVVNGLNSLRGGVVLDGFPRTVHQVDALASSSRGIDLVVQLVVSPKVAMERLLARRHCEQCGLATTTSVCGHQQRCLVCGGALLRRADDTRGAIARRLLLFDKHTRPALSWFAGCGQLVQVDGHPDVDTVTERLLGALSSRPELVPLLVPCP